MEKNSKKASLHCNSISIAYNNRQLTSALKVSNTKSIAIIIIHDDTVRPINKSTNKFNNISVQALHNE